MSFKGAKTVFFGLMGKDFANKYIKVEYIGTMGKVLPMITILNLVNQFKLCKKPTFKFLGLM